MLGKRLGLNFPVSNGNEDEEDFVRMNTTGQKHRDKHWPTLDVLNLHLVSTWGYSTAQHRTQGLTRNIKSIKEYFTTSILRILITYRYEEKLKMLSEAG